MSNLKSLKIAGLVSLVLALTACPNKPNTESKSPQQTTGYGSPNQTTQTKEYTSAPSAVKSSGKKVIEISLTDYISAAQPGIPADSIYDRIEVFNGYFRGKYRIISGVEYEILVLDPKPATLTIIKSINVELTSGTPVNERAIGDYLNTGNFGKLNDVGMQTK